MNQRRLPFLAAAALLTFPLIVARSSSPSMLDERGTLAGAPMTRPLAFESGRAYTVSLALDQPGKLDPNAVVRVTVSDAKRELVSKPLHVGDSDLFAVVRPTAEGEGRVLISGERGKTEGLGFSLSVRAWPTGAPAENPGPSVVEAEPNNSYQEATPFILGQTVFATNDDRDFISPLSPLDRYPPPELRRPMFDRNEKGVDWYTFVHDRPQPLLVHFGLDFLDREVPCDLLVYRQSGEGLVEHKAGADPVSDPHEVQALPGNKFTTRVIEPGVYFLRVTANHPRYQLRTYTYEVPPYTEVPLPEAARRAVRVGADYGIASGDSWHANTPRSGGVTTRVASTHNETQQCIACHPTHFPMRAQQVAVENGYTVRQRSALRFLAERLYNSPRPFYGHPQATWVRVISAPANVMSRLGYLLSLHERNLSREPRSECLEGVGGYLRKYYRDRTNLPPEETNGNTPLVSAYEIAGHSWAVFDELARRQTVPARRAEAVADRDRVRKLVEQDRIKDVRDLCYQTIAFLQIDRAAYAARIKANCERLISLQRASGQWAMTFDAKDSEAEFQTGHCLYTLALAGYSSEHPQIGKSIRYLLARQQPFGGWFDPQQSYENFKTPFRETQFAVMALAQFYPAAPPDLPAGQPDPGQSRWSAGFAPPPSRLELTRPVVLLEQLDQLWDTPGAEVRQQLLTAVAHDEPLVRAAACEALGRVGDASAVTPLMTALGDRLKIVRHTAAWALRELASRKHVGLSEIKRALRSDDDYTRRGAVRVFTEHFSYLTTPEKSQSAEPSIQGHCLNLTHALNDEDIFVRLYAAKALSQWFYWTDDRDTQAKIVDVMLARMRSDDHPWARRAVLENFYNLCDDNLRYLYRNWVPLLAQAEDRARTTTDHHALMNMLAGKISAALTSGNPTLRDNLLAALTQHSLRKSGDRQSYGDIIQTPAGLYSRIGNDIEQIKFYEESTAALEPALLQLLDDPATREPALIASFMLRDISNLQRLPLKMAELIATDRNARNRETAWEYYRFLPIVLTPENRAQWTKRLSGMFTGYLETRKAAFDTLARAGTTLQDEPAVVAALTDYLLSDAARPWASELMTALVATPKLHGLPEVKGFVQQSLRSEDDFAVRAALNLVLASSTLQNDITVRTTMLSQLQGAEPRPRRVLLELVNQKPALGSHLIAASVVADALDEPTLRSAALAAVEKSKPLQSNAAVQAALGASQPNSPRLDADTPPPDFDFFRANVQPLFFQPAQRDKRACVDCHFNHTILQIRRSADGRISESEARTNYLSALKVVNRADPERSLLLTKPTSDASSEGQLNAARIAHGGDKRWPTGERSREYQTLLAWIHGAKVR